jgi:hypothetical protein
MASLSETALLSHLSSFLTNRRQVLWVKTALLLQEQCQLYMAVRQLWITWIRMLMIVVHSRLLPTLWNVYVKKNEPCLAPLAHFNILRLSCALHNALVKYMILVVPQIPRIRRAPLSHLLAPSSFLPCPPLRLDYRRTTSWLAIDIQEKGDKNLSSEQQAIPPQQLLLLT